MIEAGHPVEFSATASIVAAGGPITTIKGFSLTANSDAASAIVREGGAAGTIRLTLRAIANTTAVDHRLMQIQDPHVTITGTAPSFTANL